MADHHDRASAKAPEPADDRSVLAKIPVTGEGREIVYKPGDIILEMRPFGMARDLRPLPWRQLRIGLAQLTFGFRLKLFDLARNVDFTAVCGFAQIDDLRPQRRDGFFKF